MERAPHARLTQNRGLHSLWHTIPQKSAYDPIGSILKVEIQRFLPEAYPVPASGLRRRVFRPDDQATGFRLTLACRLSKPGIDFRLRYSSTD
jgi:hypothetical protein